MPEDEEFGFWDYPYIGEFEEYIHRLKEQAVESLHEEGHHRSEEAQNLVIRRVVVTESWGRGEATYGQDTIRIVIFFERTDTDVESGLDPDFDNIARAVTERMHTLIADGTVESPPEIGEWFLNIDLLPSGVSKIEDQVSLSLGDQDGNRVYDLTGGFALEQREDVGLANLPQVPLEELRQEAEVDGEEVVEEVTEEEVTEIEEEESDDEEEEVHDYPGVPPYLRDNATSEDSVEVPVGKKDTKTVNPRDPYGFEIIQATGVPRPEFVDEADTVYEADPAIQPDVMDGVGEMKRAGRFDPTHPNTVSPGTYPRTGVYIRNYLKFNGPSYALEMFKDFSIYCQFVNSVWGYNLRIGTYQSFRNFMLKLKKMPDKGGPALVYPMTDAEADGAGFDTHADHPKVEGEKAPWLENRQYYEIVEDNEDHEAWQNPFDYLNGG